MNTLLIKWAVVVIDNASRVDGCYSTTSLEDDRIHYPLCIATSFVSLEDARCCVYVDVYCVMCCALSCPSPSVFSGLSPHRPPLRTPSLKEVKVQHKLLFFLSAYTLTTHTHAPALSLSLVAYPLTQARTFAVALRLPFKGVRARRRDREREKQTAKEKEEACLSCFHPL